MVYGLDIREEKCGQREEMQELRKQCREKEWWKEETGYSCSYMYVLKREEEEKEEKEAPCVETDLVLVC